MKNRNTERLDLGLKFAIECLEREQRLSKLNGKDELLAKAFNEKTVTADIVRKSFNDAYTEGYKTAKEHYAESVTTHKDNTNLLNKEQRLIDINSVPCTKIKVGDWTCEVFTKDDVVKARTFEIPPAKEGKWQYWTDDRKDYAECSICEYGSEGELLYQDITPYCPYCGAKLGADEELYKSVRALNEG